MTQTNFCIITIVLCNCGMITYYHSALLSRIWCSRWATELMMQGRHVCLKVWQMTNIRGKSLVSDSIIICSRAQYQKWKTKQILLLIKGVALLHNWWGASHWQSTWQYHI